jgi:hypothetical protein
VVRNKKTEPTVVLAGVPAKIVRTGVTWLFDDMPPDDAPAALKKGR